MKGFDEESDVVSPVCCSGRGVDGSGKEKWQVLLVVDGRRRLGVLGFKQTPVATKIWGLSFGFGRLGWKKEAHKLARITGPPIIQELSQNANQVKIISTIIKCTSNFSNVIV